LYHRAVKTERAGSDTPHHAPNNSWYVLAIFQPFEGEADYAHPHYYLPPWIFRYSYVPVPGNICPFLMGDYSNISILFYTHTMWKHIRFFVIYHLVPFWLDFLGFLRSSGLRLQKRFLSDDSWPKKSFFDVFQILIFLFFFMSTSHILTDLKVLEKFWLKQFWFCFFFWLRKCGSVVSLGILMKHYVHFLLSSTSQPRCAWILNSVHWIAQ
jgi:hypothetical protein